MAKSHIDATTQNLANFKKAIPFFSAILFLVLAIIAYGYFSRYNSEQHEKQSFRDLTTHLEYIKKNVKDNSLQGIHSDDGTKGSCSYSTAEQDWGCRTSIGFQVKKDNGSKPSIHILEVNKIIANTNYFKETINYSNKSEPSIGYTTFSNHAVTCTLHYHENHSYIIMECWAPATQSWYPNSEPEYSTAPGKDAWRKN